jgi:hypothetical protein
MISRPKARNRGIASVRIAIYINPTSTNNTPINIQVERMVFVTGRPNTESPSMISPFGAGIWGPSWASLCVCVAASIAAISCDTLDTVAARADCSTKPNVEITNVLASMIRKNFCIFLERAEYIKRQIFCKFFSHESCYQEIYLNFSHFSIV